jgi:hypothetical protein
MNDLLEKLGRALGSVKVGEAGPRIFCISFQRTGTTSVGRFFADHGFKVATWQVSFANAWSLAWFEGDHERIFASADFKAHQVFEDDPWWLSDFYKVLFHRFPDARFVLLERDADQWFDSMVSHSKGRTLGNTHRHAHIYDRSDEYALLSGSPGSYSNTIDNLLPLGEAHRTHYKRIYLNRLREVRLFFDRFGPERLFQGRLEEVDIWKRMGDAFGIMVKDGYVAHANASKPRNEEREGQGVTRDAENSSSAERTV